MLDEKVAHVGPDVLPLLQGVEAGTIPQGQPPEFDGRLQSKDESRGPANHVAGIDSDDDDDTMAGDVMQGHLSIRRPGAAAGGSTGAKRMATPLTADSRPQQPNFSQFVCTSTTPTVMPLPCPALFPFPSPQSPVLHYCPGCSLLRDFWIPLL